MQLTNTKYILIIPNNNPDIANIISQHFEKRYRNYQVHTNKHPQHPQHPPQYMCTIEFTTIQAFIIIYNNPNPIILNITTPSNIPSNIGDAFDRLVHCGTPGTTYDLTLEGELVKVLGWWPEA